MAGEFNVFWPIFSTESNLLELQICLWWVCATPSGRTWREEGERKKKVREKWWKKKPTSCRHRDDTPLPKETSKLPQTSCVLFKKGTAQPSARQHWLWGWCWGGKAGSKGTGYHGATSCLTGLCSFPLGQCALTCNTNPFSFPTPQLQIY